MTADQVPRIPPDFLAAERRALGDAWFGQEYLCEFLQAADQVFRPEDIARAFAAEPLFRRSTCPRPRLPA